MQIPFLFDFSKRIKILTSQIEYITNNKGRRQERFRDLITAETFKVCQTNWYSLFQVESGFDLNKENFKGQDKRFKWLQIVSQSLLKIASVEKKIAIQCIKQKTRVPMPNIYVPFGDEINYIRIYMPYNGTHWSLHNLQ